MNINALRYSLFKNAEGLKYIPNYRFIKIFDGVAMREYVYSNQKKDIWLNYDTIKLVLEKLK
jgi:hypothetical protein